GTARGGRAGAVSVQAAALTVLGGAEVTSSTFGPGDGGDVTVRVGGPLMMDAAGTDLSTSIGAQTINPARGGRGGNVTVDAGSLRLVAGSDISTVTFGPGAGGAVTVRVAGDAVLDGRGLPTGIAAQSQARPDGPGGPAGGADVEAGSLTLLNGAGVSSSTI